MQVKTVYITGPVGSGKTTLAKRLSQQSGIEFYSLDIVMYQKVKSTWGNVPRDEATRNKLFHNIMMLDSWIIEDAGRKRFKRGFEEADMIIFLYPNAIVRRIRIIKRYIKQKLKMEQCNYNPNKIMLKKMFEWTASFENGKDDLQERLEAYKEKVVILKTKHDIYNFIHSFCT